MARAATHLARSLLPLSRHLAFNPSPSSPILHFYSRMRFLSPSVLSSQHPSSVYLPREPSSPSDLPVKAWFLIFSSFPCELRYTSFCRAEHQQLCCTRFPRFSCLGGSHWSGNLESFCSGLPVWITRTKEQRKDKDWRNKQANSKLFLWFRHKGRESCGFILWRDVSATLPVLSDVLGSPNNIMRLMKFFLCL